MCIFSLIHMIRHLHLVSSSGHFTSIARIKLEFITFIAADLDIFLRTGGVMEKWWDKKSIWEEKRI